METFSALLAFCAGNSPLTGEFPAQRPVTQSSDVFLDLCPNNWANNGDAGNLIRHHAYYDVIVVMEAAAAFTETEMFVILIKFPSTAGESGQSDNFWYSQ